MKTHFEFRYIDEPVNLYELIPVTGSAMTVFAGEDSVYIDGSFSYQTQKYIQNIVDNLNNIANELEF